MTRIGEIEFKADPKDTIAEILSRYSILDLREQTDKNLADGDGKFAKTDKPIKILDKGEKNFIKWWKIVSGGNEYEVRRFENFVFCSCLDFFFGKSVCKHIIVTLPIKCPKCRRKEVPYAGAQCIDCHFYKAPRRKPKPARVFG